MKFFIWAFWVKINVLTCVLKTSGLTPEIEVQKLYTLWKRWLSTQESEELKLCVLVCAMLAISHWWYSHKSQVQVGVGGLLTNDFISLHALSCSVQFRTTPMDSTGVPHILEHTVLCGSQKYPCRDPFFKMLNRSLSTFMNAFTGKPKGSNTT